MADRKQGVDKVAQTLLRSTFKQKCQDTCGNIYYATRCSHLRHMHEKEHTKMCGVQPLFFDGLRVWYIL